jgi:excisionase family DNA binding protein
VRIAHTVADMNEPAQTSVDERGGAEQGGEIAVSVNEAARRLGIGRQTFYNLLRKQVLPSFKIGKRRLVRVAALEEFARNREAAN